MQLDQKGAQMRADVLKELQQEWERLSGYSIDRGSAEAGVSANLLMEAINTIETQEALLAALKAQEPVAVGYVSDAGLQALKERGLVSIYRKKTKVCHIPVSVSLSPPPPAPDEAREAVQLLDDLLTGVSIHNDRFPDKRIEGPLWKQARDLVHRARSARP